MNIVLVAAVAKNRVIGRQGKIPWHIKDDLLHFKKLTTESAVIMGRKTYESIGKPLPNRTNIVMTRRPRRLKDVREVYNKNQALAVALEFSKDIYIIGGENVYREFLPLAKKMFLTEIALEVSGDTYFPEWATKEWVEVSRINKEDQSQDIKYSFVEYKRVS